MPRRPTGWPLAGLALLLLVARPVSAQGSSCASSALASGSCSSGSASDALDATCCKPLADALSADDCYSAALKDSATRKAM